MKESEGETGKQVVRRKGGSVGSVRDLGHHMEANGHIQLAATPGS